MIRSDLIKVLRLLLQKNYTDVSHILTAKFDGDNTLNIRLMYALLVSVATL
jgi:hypothetical protein